MKEALCIQSTPADSHFNKDSWYKLPDCWFALNRKLRGEAILGQHTPLACTGGGSGGSSTPLSLASAPSYIILVRLSAFYLLSSLMTYTFSKTVLGIFQILYKTLCA